MSEMWFVGVRIFRVPIFCLVVHWCCITPILAGCVGDLSLSEVNSLELLFNFTDGLHWRWDPLLPASTHWSFPVSSLDVPCIDKWQGVTCSSSSTSSSGSSCVINQLSLNSMNLRGFIPSQLGQLTSLESLTLFSNSLTGSIPTELGLLNLMSVLDLSTNSLMGPIPSELGQLTSMTKLMFYSNTLTGSIPSDLGNITSLTEISLYTNSLTGTIPSVLGRLTSLIALYLYGNLLTGIIPTELGQLTAILVLDLYSNRLTGTIPTELGKLNATVNFGVNSNSLTGTIPSELGQLTLLTALNLFSNSLTGSIPKELMTLNLVSVFSIYSNYLTGSIPSEIGNLTALTVLFLYSNTLSGSIPSQVGLLTGMNELSFFSACLTGSMPSELGQLVSIDVLDLSANSLTYSLPSELGRLCLISELYLFSNCLSGTIPVELANLTSMTVLYLYSNSLTGSMPSQLGLLSAMDGLYLNSNSFTGTIPVEISSLSALLEFDVVANLLTGGLQNLPLNILVVDASSNLFSGPISVMSSSLSQLRSFNISDNEFSSSIPSFLCQNSMMQSIDISRNHLTGELPSCISHLQQLEQLVASNNRLSGALDSLNPDLSTNSSLSALSVLDLSFNDLSGSIPEFLFGLSSLQSLILSSNCFHGSLPDSICTAQNMTELILDGLSSSAACSLQSFKVVLRGVFPLWFISGGIPYCVWNSMPYLETLHLSGNGLGGSLGHLSSQSLSDVSLAHNRLTGTVPLSFQHYGKFIKLDLSSNRLDGTLSSTFTLNASQVFLNVSLNRLSGEIPESFMQAPGMSVVEGNMFACAGGQLPHSDNEDIKYTCGSDGLNDVIYAWIVGAAVGLAAVMSFNAKTCFHVPSLSGLDSSLSALVRSSAGLVVWLALVCSSVYITLKIGPWQDMFSTHTYQYGWVDSAVYLHGLIPACLVMLMLMGCVWIAYLPLLGLCKSSAESGGGGGGGGLCGDVCVGGGGGDSNKDSGVKSNASSVKLVLLHLVNLAIVLVVNIVYIYVSLGNISANNLLLVQFALSLFKVGWKSLAIPRLVKWSECSLFQHVTLTVVAFVLGPILSTFFSQSSCFLYALTGQPAIQSSYELNQFDCHPVGTIICFDNTCHTVLEEECGFASEASVYFNLSVGWIYSYQCSSALLIDYVPVFILTSLVSSVFSPAVLWLWEKLNFPHFGPTSRHSTLLSAVIKMVVDMTLLLTFGLADPLLSIPVALDCVALVYRVMNTLSGEMDDDELLQRNRERDARTDVMVDSENTVSAEVGYAMRSILRLMSVVIGLFWSLFMLDMIGDKYGGVAGGCSMAVPLVVVWMLMTVLSYMRRSKRAKEEEDDDVKEIGSVSITSPIFNPTDINRDF